MAALIPDKKCGVYLDLKKTFLLWKNAASYHLGLVTPSTTDGAPLVVVVCREFSQVGHELVARLL